MIKLTLLDKIIITLQERRFGDKKQGINETSLRVRIEYRHHFIFEPEGARERKRMEGYLMMEPKSNLRQGPPNYLLMMMQI